jgi:putative FmdB family regulatory protein
MPIYEYSCKKCGQTIEVIQKMSDPELKKHEKCGGVLTKLISASGFQFKGTGWYVTDYARKSESSGENSGGKETHESVNKKEAASKEAASKEKKPAATTNTDGGKASTSKSSAESKTTKSSDKKE